MEIVNSKRSFQSDTYGSDLTIEEYTQRLQEEDPDCAPRAYVKIDLGPGRPGGAGHPV